uniref:chloroplast envelope membrane protein n=1 Tax=Pallavicinia lyellii TaxID=56939 RepID=UPI001D101DDB|nr:chloroplast envelope membrane protein [Pallavicinia lyellii]QZZ24673.1 chloroplast envelope membrane protein [Pallavicinia lyellii]QZZ24757.1 chloroplast envelope membrane protein [Pallavicinia lyellii]
MKHSHYCLPYRCLQRAYRAGKRIQKIKRDYFLYKDTLFHSKRFSQSIVSYTDTELNNFVFVIYLNLLGYRISLYSIKSLYFFRFMILNQFYSFGGVKEKYEHCKEHSKTIFEDAGGLVKIMNRKLAWIKATLDDLYIWKRCYLFSLSIGTRNKTEYSSLSTRSSGLTTIAYESMGLLPRSITRTFSRFQTELMNQSSSLVLWEFRSAKYQALASLQYIGCLILIPLATSIFFQKSLLEPWISHWWNRDQSQIFIAFFQEEKALEKLQEIEELFWLDKILANALFGIQLQDFDSGIHRQTIELVGQCNNNSIETVSHLLTDGVYSTTLISLFISGKERLAILNSWAQELFYSLSDTMKAFFILLLTDLCIGFHSPHGWEIVISSCLEHFGFVRNKHVISCFVSTFPVILDTVFKYLIFRHLNRISPSIVATYHTMNE